MGLLGYKEWLGAQDESSAATRSKHAAAMGLGPDVADVFGHATPPPAIAAILLKKLGDPNHDKIKKPKKKKDSIPLPESADLTQQEFMDLLSKKLAQVKDLNEKAQIPNYAFDQFIKSAEKAKGDIDKEEKSADKKSKDLDKKAEDKKKKKPSPPKFGTNPAARAPFIKNEPMSYDPNKPGKDKEAYPDPEDRTKAGVEPDDPKNEEYLWDLYANTSFDQPTT